MRDSGRWLWARSEVRQHWRALVVLGVLAGVATGLAVSAVVGARRTATVYDRWRAATAAPDALVFGTQVGKNDLDYSPVSRLPEVQDAGMFELAAMGLREYPDIGALAPGDSRLYRTFARPLLRAGRLPDPNRVDEIVINRVAAKKFRLRVGGRVTIVTSPNRAAFYGEVPMTGGPVVRATIVGIGDSMIDLVFLGDQPGFTPSGALLEREGDRIGHAPNLVVKLRPGTDVARFSERAAAALRLPGIPIRPLAEDAKRVTHATDLERTGLLLFAAAIAVAALVLIGQALARVVYGSAASAPTLDALGMTRRDIVGGMVAPHLLTAFVATTSSTATAILLSVRFPIGLARQLEPDLGLHADWPRLLLGAGVVTALTLLAATLAALRATSSRSRPSVRPSPVVQTVAGVGSLPMAVGTGLALERGRGERALPVRPALASAVVGVLGIVAAVALVHGIDDAVRDPGRSGQTWDARVYPDSLAQYRALPGALQRLPSVGAVAYMRKVNVEIDGTGTPVFAIEPVRGDLQFVTMRGRAPVALDEIALGPATARALHVRIGDDVRLGGDRPRTVRIVGTTLLPQTPHSSFDQGAWVSAPTMLAMVGPPNDTNAANVEEVVAVARRGGSSHARLIRDITPLATGGFEEAGVPQDVFFLRNVRTLPFALAVFLVLLSLAAFMHALITAVRRRRHDLAVLKAMGLRPREAAACIAWQARTIGLIALAIGIPLGIVAGRLAWQWVADRTPLVYESPVALLAIVVLVPVVLLVAHALAFAPARRAARLRAADVLRSE